MGNFALVGLLAVSAVVGAGSGVAIAALDTNGFKTSATYFCQTASPSMSLIIAVTALLVGYVAEDGPARRATVEQLKQLQWDPPSGPASNTHCNATVVMIDDRAWVPPNSSGGESMPPYYAKTMALNYLYAQRHQMEFVLVRPSKGEWLSDGPAGLCPAWCRVKVLASFVATWRSRVGGCHWLLYIDSDAYVREQHTNFVHRLSAARHSDIHIAIAREEPPSGAFRSPRRRAHGVRVPSLNAGVLFVRASSWSASFLASWIRAPDTPVCEPFRTSWPCEQQCFHELLRNRTLLPRGWRQAIATAPMQLFNSPWGTFVRHLWGGPGVELRKRAFDDE